MALHSRVSQAKPGNEAQACLSCSGHLNLPSSMLAQRLTRSLGSMLLSTALTWLSRSLPSMLCGKLSGMLSGCRFPLALASGTLLVCSLASLFHCSSIQTSPWYAFQRLSFLISRLSRIPPTILSSICHVPKSFRYLHPPMPSSASISSIPLDVLYHRVWLSLRLASDQTERESSEMPVRSSWPAVECAL